jgi:hypothetical protein
MIISSPQPEAPAVVIDTAPPTRADTFTLADPIPSAQWTLVHRLVAIREDEVMVQALGKSVAGQRRVLHDLLDLFLERGASGLRRLIGQRLWVRATDVKVELYQDYDLVATHRRARPGQRRALTALHAA